ncbi:MAG: glucuronate isomerase, partial [Bacteroidales bacterium]|nr:glucuronate isomerase [Bacteroidales bacterium]
MSVFINEDFMLTNDAARSLYHENAESLPIIDYHCHLNPQQIAEDIRFRDISDLWLSGDHYKWRALRANGVAEKYVTGDAPAWEKFEKWAETVPYTMRNPLYHWTHIELMRTFGIGKTLSPATAREIFEECNSQLAQPGFSAKGLIRKFNVEAICTTDDPVDDLRWHKKIAEEPFGTKVLPTWRPDKAIAIENPAAYKDYVEKLGEAADMEIRTYSDMIEALRKRHLYFEMAGCKLSDHGLDTFHAADYTASEIEAIFSKVMSGQTPDAEELEKYRSAGLHDLAVMDAESGWAQQFHMGVIRNNRSSLMRSFGPDAGTDSILDLQC